MDMSARTPKADRLGIFRMRRVLSIHVVVGFRGRRRSGRLRRSGGSSLLRGLDGRGHHLAVLELIGDADLFTRLEVLELDGLRQFEGFSRREHDFVLGGIDGLDVSDLGLNGRKGHG